MPPKYTINYTKAVVICHGKSEIHIVKFIRSNLRLSIEYCANKGGKYSFQITDLNNLLKRRPFNSLRSMMDAYNVCVEKKKIKDFKLFIIMDTDDCTDDQRENYINKEMFKGHWLFDYIVPIYNNTNLEDVMCECGIMVRKIKDRDKENYYSEIFPINNNPLSPSTIEQIRHFSEKIKICKNSNMNEFAEYCMSYCQLFDNHS